MFARSARFCVRNHINIELFFRLSLQNVIHPHHLLPIPRMKRFSQVLRSQKWRKKLPDRIVCCFRSPCEESRLEGEEQRAAHNQHHHDTYIFTRYTVVFIAIVVENVGFPNYSASVPTEKQQPTRTFSAKSCTSLEHRSESVLLFHR